MDSSKELNPIGGEFWFDLNLFSRDEQKLDDYIMLSGGQCSINYILEDIDLKDEYILVPSYLCPSILYWFDKKSIKYSFYNINRDFSIDLENLELNIKNYKPKALLFINYFGFYHSDETLKKIKQMKEQGIIVIEDAVQMLWTKAEEKFIGDYVFNSFRKFIPIDGSFVICKNNKLNTTKEEMDEYLKLSYRARMLKTMYQGFGLGEEEEFLHYYEMAEKAYYEREHIKAIDEKSLGLIKRLDMDFIKSRRVSNYRYLYRKLKTVGIEPMFDYNISDDTIPLGLPILIDNRDNIRKELRRKGIYCPVHWDIRQQWWANEFKDSYYIADKILTLPIDQRYDFNDMDRLFNGFINLYKLK